jgi:hypothetical protein
MKRKRPEKDMVAVLGGRGRMRSLGPGLSAGRPQATAGFQFPGSELVKVRHRRRRDPPQHVLQPLRRIQPVPPRRDQQVVDHRAPPSRIGMPNEQPVLLPNRRRPNQVLN